MKEMDYSKLQGEGIVFEPAFPVATIDGYTQVGMSFRDYAAIHAPDLASIEIKSDRELLAGYSEPPRTASIFEQLKFNALVEARIRYIYADAVMKAREVE